jgi:hypothetical protein
MSNSIDSQNSQALANEILLDTQAMDLLRQGAEAVKDSVKAAVGGTDSAVRYHLSSSLKTVADQVQTSGTSSVSSDSSDVTISPEQLAQQMVKAFADVLASYGKRIENNTGDMKNQQAISDAQLKELKAQIDKLAQAIADYEKKQEEAAKANKWLKIFTPILLVATALTGGIAGAIVAGIFAGLSYSGEMAKIQSYISDHLPPDVAKGIVVAAVALIAYAICPAAVVGDGIAEAATKGNGALGKLYNVMPDDIAKIIATCLIMAAGMAGTVGAVSAGEEGIAGIACVKTATQSISDAMATVASYVSENMMTIMRSAILAASMTESSLTVWSGVTGMRTGQAQQAQGVPMGQIVTIDGMVKLSQTQVQRTESNFKGIYNEMDAANAFAMHITDEQKALAQALTQNAV